MSGYHPLMPPRAKPTRERRRHFFRQWRESKYPNQKDAEDALGWSQSKVSRLESGLTPYNQDDLEHAAEVFGCSPADLITRGPGSSEPRLPIKSETDVLAFLARIDGLTENDINTAFAVIKNAMDLAATRAEREPSAPHDQRQPASYRHVSEPSQ